MCVCERERVERKTRRESEREVVILISIDDLDGLFSLYTLCK